MISPELIACRTMPFVHPALPSGQDAIRILKMEPGDFSSPLAGTLTSVAFSDRPKYLALSYTWGHSYPDNLKLPLSPIDSRLSIPSPSSSPDRSPTRLSPGPRQRRSSSIDQRMADRLYRSGLSPPPVTNNIPGEIVLNGGVLGIGNNLQLALLHLRSPIHVLTVWVDAICINQADEIERNHQVSMMAFIYTRATNVVAWLGTKAYPPMNGLFRSMSLEWKAGQTQHLGAFLEGQSKLKCSFKPDQGTFARMMDSTYWKRMWIVQEVCLPRLLLIMYGSDIWTHEEFREWEYPPLVHPETRLTQPPHGCSNAALRLLDTRDRRHTNVMRLENLIEVFANNDCSELRDRIYGVVGCANDVKPFAGLDESANSLQAHIDTLNSGMVSSYHPKRGVGSLRIDYSCTFYDLWTRVVSFVYFQAKGIQHNTSSHLVVLGRSLTDDHQRDFQLLEERQLSVVRTAGIIQDALGQKVEEEMANVKETSDEQEWPVITALGFIAGRVVQFGPAYASLVSSSSAAQDWTSCWIDHYQAEADFEKLRWINEEYAAKILGYHATDLSRIRNIYNPHALARPIGQSGIVRIGPDPDHAKGYKDMQASMGIDSEGPRICLGTGYVMGLVSSAATVGDVIVKFWNCNAAIVMRPVEPLSKNTTFMLVGRADIAEVVDRTVGTSLKNRTVPNSEDGSGVQEAVHVSLNLRTLQKITGHLTPRS